MVRSILPVLTSTAGKGCVGDEGDLCELIKQKAGFRAPEHLGVQLHLGLDRVLDSEISGLRFFHPNNAVIDRVGLNLVYI